MNNLQSKKKIIAIVSAIVAVCILGGVVFFVSGLGAVSKDDTADVVVTVESGSGAYDILYALDEAGLVKNGFCGKLYMKFFAPDTLQANTYVLNKTLSLKEQVNIIATGDLHYVQSSRFTIIEGATYKDAAAAISKTLGFSEEEIIAKWSDTAFLKELIGEYWFLTEEILKDGIICPLEGYLYPETYTIMDSDPDIEGVTRMIMDLTGSQLEPLKEDIPSLGMSCHEFLAFASVVENESLFEEDRAKIAGVFMNRLKKDIALQSDITVLYALGEKRVDVTYADLEVDSLYNTYKHAGLPVGPVSNPYIKTMEDCINYEKHDYYYFFATEDGKVLYTKTLAEHEQVVEENLWY
ncbi:MAG: endolytic transglycosylase MltG [Firmicutes bacterium]|nr:endolytic transglycosylase MltG [Bacillota bacterium]